VNQALAAEAADRRVAPRLRHWGLVLLVGLGTGVVTQVGQSVLPTGWSQAANAISPWLLVAFLAGSSMPSRASAITAGIVTLVLALVGYYATTQIRYGIGGGSGSLVFWGLGALTGGPVFGLAGRAWRTGTDLERPIALGLLAAVAIAEGIYHALVLVEPSVAAGFVMGGLLVPLVLGRTWQDRLRSYVAAVPALGLGGLGYVAFTVLYGLTARI
jgi:uncharacterized protein DUF6518